MQLAQLPGTPRSDPGSDGLIAEADFARETPTFLALVGGLALLLGSMAIAGEVFHCGFHSAASFGAASYLIVRPQSNVLVDSPRFAGPLVRR